MKQFFFIISIFFLMTVNAQQSNYHFSFTDSTTLSATKIWKVWTDVANWEKWDKGLKEASLDGEFKAGATGKLISDNGRQSKFTITLLEQNQSYTFKTRIPFGWLIIKRTLEVKENRTYFTHDVKFTGLLKRVLGNKLGKRYRAMLPEVLEAVKRIAEPK